MSKRIGGTLENWFTHSYDHPDYPEGVTVVYGDIYGDSHWPDGQDLRTSRVVALDPDLDRVETLNTIYKLGTKADKPI